MGQILALSVMLIVLAGWRKRPAFQPFSRIANMLLIVGGFYLCLMQLHGYSHVTDPDEFGFSVDNHAHENIRMDEARAQEFKQNTTHDSID